MKNTRLLLGLIFAFSTFFLSKADNQIELPVDNTDIQEHKQFMSEFIRSLGLNEYVVYKKNKLVLLTRYSQAETVGQLFVYLVMIIVNSSIYRDINRRDPNGNFIKYSFPLMAALGCAAAVYRISKHCNTQIFLTLDNKGIALNGICIDWKDIDKINLKHHIPSQEGIVTGTKKAAGTNNKIISWDDADMKKKLEYTLERADFLDAEGTKKGSIRLNSNEPLPIKPEQFLRIVEHYWSTFGSQKKGE